MRVDGVEPILPHHLREGHSLLGALTLQSAPQVRKPAKLLVRIGGRMIRDIIGGSRKAVEGHDRAAMLRLKQDRSDGKILVAMPLAGGEIDHVRAHRPTAACARPFHMPPRPRPCCQADRIVQPA